MFPIGFPKFIVFSNVLPTLFYAFRGLFLVSLLATNPMIQLRTRKFEIVVDFETSTSNSRHPNPGLEYELNFVQNLEAEANR